MIAPRPWLPRPDLSLFLAVLWLLLQNTVTAGHLLLGLLLGWLIPLATRAFWPEPAQQKRYGRFLRFLGIVFYDIVRANMTVAWTILFRRRHIRPAFIELPLALTDDFAITILASTISLTPGTVSADLNDQRTCLLIHALDVEDPGQQVREIKERYESRLREIFE